MTVTARPLTQCQPYSVNAPTTVSVSVAEVETSSSAARRTQPSDRKWKMYAARGVAGPSEAGHGEAGQDAGATEGAVAVAVVSPAKSKTISTHRQLLTWTRVGG